MVITDEDKPTRIILIGYDTDAVVVKISSRCHLLALKYRLREFHNKNNKDKEIVCYSKNLILVPLSPVIFRQYAHEAPVCLDTRLFGNMTSGRFM